MHFIKRNSTKDAIQALLVVAQKYDITRTNKPNAVFEPTPHCINLWCTPDDHPTRPQWEQTQMVAGMFAAPCAFIGTFSWVGGITLHVHPTDLPKEITCFTPETSWAVKKLKFLFEKAQQPYDLLEDIKNQLLTPSLWKREEIERVDREVYTPLHHENPASNRQYRFGLNIKTGERYFLVDVNPLPHVPLHSPTGMTWGYEGSGPADLALSILADYYNQRFTQEDLEFGRPKCVGHHQAFKKKYIAPLTEGGHHVIHGQEIQKFLQQVEKQS